MEADTATVTLARDEFTSRRRELKGHPEAVEASTRIDIVNFFGDVATWVIDLIRVDGEVTAFVQQGRADGYVRMVIPPQVTAAIARHQAGLVTKARRKAGRRVAADRKAQGLAVGNPQALAQARAERLGGHVFIPNNPGTDVCETCGKGRRHPSHRAGGLGGATK